MKTTWIKSTSLALMVSMGAMSLPVNAAMMSTDVAVNAAATAATAVERAALVDFMARSDVQQQLTRMGVEASDAEARIAALSDEEVMQLHGKMESLPAGGSALGVVVFIFVVLLVTDILGFTKIFPFTRSLR